MHTIWENARDRREQSFLAIGYKHWLKDLFADGCLELLEKPIPVVVVFNGYQRNAENDNVVVDVLRCCH